MPSPSISSLPHRQPAPLAAMVIAGGAWLAAAIGAGASGLLARVPAPLPQAMCLALAILVVAVSRHSKCVRAWLDSLDLRLLAAIHVTRFVGGYFLVLYSQGQLPFGFAVPAAGGDMLVAAGALVLLSLPVDRSFNRNFWVVWNTAGLVDIVLVVLAAARMGMVSRGSMAPLLHLPLSLLPTFLVPLIIGSHAELFRRLRQLPSAGARE